MSVTSNSFCAPSLHGADSLTRLDPCRSVLPQDTKDCRYWELDATCWRDTIILPVRSYDAPRGCRSQGEGRKFLRNLVTAALLFWVSTAGCDNTCVSFTSNPPKGTLEVKVSDPKPTCTLTKANGTVGLQLSGSPTSGEGSGAPSIQHIFVSLRGIEAHPSTIANEDSPDWQELAPRLEQQPVQVNLTARTSDSCASRLIAEATVPAGIYRQIRLLLVPNKPATSEPVPEENVCGSAGFNCIVATDGSIRSLLLDGAAPELRISTESVAGGFFRVLPDADTGLVIERNGRSSLALPAGDAVRLVPVFTVALRGHAHHLSEGHNPSSCHLSVLLRECLPSERSRAVVLI